MSPNKVESDIFPMDHATGSLSLAVAVAVRNFVLSEGAFFPFPSRSFYDFVAIALKYFLGVGNAWFGFSRNLLADYRRSLCKSGFVVRGEHSLKYASSSFVLFHFPDMASPRDDTESIRESAPRRPTKIHTLLFWMKRPSTYRISC